MEYRANKKVKDLGAQQTDKFADHPAKQIEEILNQESLNVEPVVDPTNNLFNNIPSVDDNTPAYSSTPSEILSKKFGIPTVDSSDSAEEKQNDNTATENIIPH
jgi:hypothetical protein